MIYQLFLAHPRSVGEDYWQHAATAARFGGSMVTGGLACLIHAVIPALFTRSASDAVKKLYTEMKARQPALSDRPPSFTKPEWLPEYEI
jgi:hypothetical protein